MYSYVYILHCKKSIPIYNTVLFCTRSIIKNSVSPFLCISLYISHYIYSHITHGVHVFMKNCLLCCAVCCVLCAVLCCVLCVICDVLKNTGTINIPSLDIQYLYYWVLFFVNSLTLSLLLPIQ